MWKTQIRQTAERQHGLVSIEQFRETNATRSQIQHELENGGWTKIQRGVWSLDGAPVSNYQHAMAAVLADGPGGVLSHQTAAWLWDFPGFSCLPINVTRLRGSNGTTPRNVVVHRVRAMPAAQITGLVGLPVVRPEVLMIQLAGILHPMRVERLLDNAWSRRLLSGESLGHLVEQLSARGRRGIPLLRDLLERRGPGWIPPASGLESRVMHLLDQHGLADFERQVNLGAESWAGRVDFVHREARLVVEVQSERYHTALSSQLDDRQRKDRLQQAGFEVVEVWEHDVWHAPQQWIDRVRFLVTRPEASRLHSATAQARSGT